MRVTYEITTGVAPDLEAEYERYMRERHIPDLLATGCFDAASFSTSATGRYRIRYEAPDQATLDRYLAEHATRLRDHFAATFPSGVVVDREAWTVMESWGGGPATP